MLPAILGYDVICGGSGIGIGVGAPSVSSSSFPDASSRTSGITSTPLLQVMSAQELMEAIQEAEPALEKPCLLPLLDSANIGKPICGEDGITFGFLPEDVSDSTVADNAHDGNQEKAPSLLLLSKENQHASFRAAVKYALIGRRREAVAAMAEGFRGKGHLSPPLAALLMRSFSHKERQQVVSGEEKVAPEMFLSLLSLDHVSGTEVGDGAAVRSGAAEGRVGHAQEEICDIGAEGNQKQQRGTEHEHDQHHQDNGYKDDNDNDDLAIGYARQQNSIEEQNFACFRRVVASAAFGSTRLKSLLRFITSCDSIQANTKIRISFDPCLPVSSFPEAHTCTSQLVLSSERPYPSDAFLLQKLVTCTEHSTGFGFK